MLRYVLVGIALLGAAGAASAKPLLLSDQQLDTVTSGRVTAIEFQRVVQNGTLGFFAIVTEIDEITGQPETRTFGGSFTIPTITFPTIGFDLTIGTGS
jgi:hypothetical protein